MIVNGKEYRIYRMTKEECQTLLTMRMIECDLCMLETSCDPSDHSKKDSAFHQCMQGVYSDTHGMYWVKKDEQV